MPSNYTENYQLSQWEADDRVLRTDFNADNAKIDGALKAASDARKTMQTTLNTKGNCSIGISTYAGTGTYGPDYPTRITFPRMPAAYIIAGDGVIIGRGGGEQAGIVFRGSSATACSVINTIWSGNTLSFSHKHAAGQLNSVPYEYVVIAFYAEDEE